MLGVASVSRMQGVKPGDFLNTVSSHSLSQSLRLFNKQRGLANANIPLLSLCTKLISVCLYTYNYFIIFLTLRRLCTLPHACQCNSLVLSRRLESSFRVPSVWPVLSGLSCGNFSLSATLIIIVSFLPKTQLYVGSLLKCLKVALVYERLFIYIYF